MVSRHIEEDRRHPLFTEGFIYLDCFLSGRCRCFHVLFTLLSPSASFISSDLYRKVDAHVLVQFPMIFFLQGASFVISPVFGGDAPSSALVFADVKCDVSRTCVPATA